MFPIVIALVFTLVLMFLTWLFARKVDNYGIIDAVWSFSFFIHGLIFLSLTDGFYLRKYLFLTMIGLWSIRLGYYLTVRIYKHHPQEDTRYALLRQNYGESFQKRFLIFFMYQALSVSILTIPFYFSFKNDHQELHWIEVLGFILWTISLIGESISDWQMSKFKAQPENKGQVCDVGLWKYSRHPNYFFESCIWFSFFVFMLGTEKLYWSIYAPLIILFLLVKVTGVPPSEEQSLKSRGDLYRVYQRKTSMFVPWFNK